MEDKVVKIDIREAISSKLPKASRWIPGFVYRWLARLIRQDELNRVLCENRGKTGSAFAEGALQTLGVSVRVIGEENIPASGRFVFVSNHPLGGLDGIGLIAFLGKRYGDDHLRFLVNDVLMAVKPLDNVFLPINKYGSQSRESMRAVDAAYAGDFQIGTFPAGLCSREETTAAFATLNGRNRLSPRAWKRIETSFLYILAVLIQDFFINLQNSARSWASSST